MPTITKRTLCVMCRRKPAEPRTLYCPECARANNRSREMMGPKKAPNEQRAKKQINYGFEWRRIRREVLKAHDIPTYLWSLYDVHHYPDYNPVVEPDHSKYALTPVLKGDHKRHTARHQKRDETGRFKR